MLVTRLADEASCAAEQVLRMCVRALDYVSPVDLRFGEYLRAIITADTDLVRDDSLRYRVAVCEAFRKWGIRVPGCISMAPDSLLWDTPDFNDLEADQHVIDYLKRICQVERLRTQSMRAFANYSAPCSSASLLPAMLTRSFTRAS
jgi:hypothetical protein